MEQSDELRGKKMFYTPQRNEKACKESLYEANRYSQSHTLFSRPDKKINFSFLNYVHFHSNPL